MAPPRTDRFWSEVICTLVANDGSLSDRKIAQRLLDMERECGRNDAPSARTVNRIRQGLPLTPAATLRGYRVFHWPDSMLYRDLPWEASQSAFELLLHLRKLERPMEVPVRLATWFWRVTQSAPEAPLPIRLQIAVQLATWEAGGWPNGPERYAPELYLALSPWRSEEHENAYLVATEKLGFPGHPFIAKIAGGLEALPTIRVHDRMSPTGLILDFNLLVPYVALAVSAAEQETKVQPAVAPTEFDGLLPAPRKARGSRGSRTKS